MAVDRRVGILIIVAVVAVLLIAALANGATRSGLDAGASCAPEHGQVDHPGCPRNGGAHD